ncbi:MAG: hypothetical protein HQM12_11995 [SAR324 cluster bacterium]|nr:hypothetical protein [SAR324 cluster bacterium]
MNSYPESLTSEKQFVLVILAIFLITFLIFQSAFHEHEDHHVHDDCTICMLVISPLNSDYAALSLPPVFLTIIGVVLIPNQEPPGSETIFPSAQPRAPPASSYLR